MARGIVLAGPMNERGATENGRGGGVGGTVAATALWAGVLGGSIYLINRIARERRADAQQQLDRVAYAQLVLGLTAAACFAWRRLCSGKLDTGDGGGGRSHPVASSLLILAGIQAGQYALTVPGGLRVQDPVRAARALLRYVLLVGLVEELWFRGLWFEVCGHRFWPSVIAGSALFGLYHAPHGWRSVVMTAGIGAVFAVARYRGVPLWALAVVHGLIDWLNREILPGARFRIAPSKVPIVFPAYTLMLAGAVAALPGLTNFRASR